MKAPGRSKILYRCLVAAAIVAGLAALPPKPFPNPLRDASMALAMSAQVKRGADCSFLETFATAWKRQRNDRVEKHAAASVQLLEKSEGRLELYRTHIGDFWTPSGNRSSLEYLFIERQRQPMRDQVRAGEVVIDCGANIGVFTREALHAGASRVLAIEPLPLNAECLRRTFTSEIRDGRVIVIEKAAWNKADVLKLSTVTWNTEMATLVLDHELRSAGGKVFKVSVAGDRIDAMVKDAELSRVDLIKMDIEGAERYALEGAEWTVKTFKPRLSLAAYHLADDPEALTSLALRFRPGYARRAGACVINRSRCSPESLFFE